MEKLPEPVVPRPTCSPILAPRKDYTQSVFHKRLGANQNHCLRAKARVVRCSIGTAEAVPPEAEHLSKQVPAKSWRIACFCLNEGRSHRGIPMRSPGFLQACRFCRLTQRVPSWHQTCQCKNKCPCLRENRVYDVCKVVLVFVGKVCSRGASLKDSCKWTQSVTSNLA